MAQAKRDGNFITSTLLVGSDGATFNWEGDQATGRAFVDIAGGSGTVTSVSVVTANGVSGTVATATTTPAITLTLGAITPSAIQVSGLTASEIVITDASKNLVSAAVATYPSLTELTYVKGVTSAIQTQINAKAPSTSPTFATSITGSYLTASEILITDASKNIVSAAVATYPSLTELTYVKGVTSAIQTQLNAKGVGTVTSVSFTGGLISVATATSTPALTVAGTSGGIPYFSSGTTWATSAALAANAIVIGGGAGATPATTTTGANVLTALGVAVGSAGAFVVNGGALGTPSSGTVTNLTGTASININGTVGATTPAAGTFTTVVAGSTTSLLLGTAGSAVGNIGFRNATSGTITLAPVTGALGTVTLTLPAATDTLVAKATTDTLTNKRVQPRILSAASYTTDTGTSLNIDNLDIFIVTAQAGALLFNAPGGTLAQGEKLIIRIKDNGTSRALTYNAVFRALGTALPTATTISKTMYMGFFYNSTDTKWDLVSLATEA